MSIICLPETVRNVVLKTLEFVSIFILPKAFSRSLSFYIEPVQGKVFLILTTPFYKRSFYFIVLIINDIATIWLLA